MRVTTSENVQMAFTALRTNRFRSALTVLGIIIGITTVVTVSSLLTGLRKGIVTFFQEFGPNNIFVARYSGDPGAPPRQKEVRRKPLHPSYAETIKRLARSVEDVSIQLFVPSITRGQPITARVPGFESDNVNVASSTANNFQISPRDLAKGRVFTAEEDSRGAKVAVIGASLAEVLFPDGKAVGKPMIVSGAEYTVIGVFAPAKGGFFGENGLDYQVLIPLQTARQRYPQLENFFITVRAKEGQRDAALDEAQAIVRKLRRVPEGAENDFNISTADQIIKQFDQITGAVLMVSIAISALGLLVGGIGVMNIMLVSVTERTREIGIRKSVGATNRQIVGQFLVEAIVLSLAGGILGIALSVAANFVIRIFTNLQPVITLPVIVVATGVSLAVGLVFGITPAVKAARKDPITALRYE